MLPLLVSKPSGLRCSGCGQRPPLSSAWLCLTQAPPPPYVDIKAWGDVQCGGGGGGGRRPAGRPREIFKAMHFRTAVVVVGIVYSSFPPLSSSKSLLSCRYTHCYHSLCRHVVIVVSSSTTTTTSSSSSSSFSSSSFCCGWKLRGEVWRLSLGVAPRFVLSLGGRGGEELEEERETSIRFLASHICVLCPASVYITYNSDMT
ncbi:hypothetical protein E2C01_075849 [Portunus trituberculatus]|uniref:Uncharacterized protein n=1 Tax=Portunus trituberculatus TaxID=210409 RepID=A0A5B7IBQ5_PORTR|nr:hypothetical protein [Portunus trituberculatus]